MDLIFSKVINIKDYKMKKHKITPESIFLSAYTIWVGIFFINTLTLLDTFLPQTLFLAMRMFVLFLLVVKELWILKFSLKDLMAWLFIFLSLMISIKSNSGYFFDVALLIYSSRCCKFETLLKRFIFVVIILSVITVLSSKIQLIENIYFINDGRIRQSLGFSYTTYLPQLFFFITMAFITMKKEKYNILHCLIILIINFMLFKLTDTKNPFFLTVGYAVGILLFNKIKSLNLVIKKISFLMPCSFIVFSSTIYYLSTSYTKSKVGIVLNNILSGRLNLGYNALSKYGITYFGQYVRLFGVSDARLGNIPYGEGYNYIDSSYLQLLILNGWIYTIILISLYTIVMIKVYNSKNIYLLISLVFVSFHAMFDPQLMMPWISPFPFAIAFLLKSATNMLQTDNNLRLRQTYFC